MLNDTHVCLSQTLQRLKMADAIYAVRESLWASSIYPVYERLAAGLTQVELHTLALMDIITFTHKKCF